MVFHKTQEPIERFMQKFSADENGCWIWSTGKNHAGYGKFFVDGSDVRAHRWSYEWFVGPIAAGLTVDHLCNVRQCVNPEHLRAVTASENCLAPHSNATARLNVYKTHCPRRHELAQWNINKSSAERGRRVCKACNLARARNRYKGRPEGWWTGEADRLYAASKLQAA